MQLYVTSIDLFAHIMVMSVDVLCPRVINIIFHEHDEGLIVGKHRDGVKSCLKSFLSLISHMPSAEAIDPAMSSASIDEHVTSPCFFNAQEIGAPLKVKIHLLVDF